MIFSAISSSTYAAHACIILPSAQFDDELSLMNAHTRAHESHLIVYIRTPVL
eukprot:m.835573 g.835573  ORF g.835573 m.835573 type:complete len:52 (-) comp23455_c0_seq28:18-173(-)